MASSQSSRVPGDKRNLDAVELLDQLAATAKDVEANLLAAYAKAWDEGGYRASELQSEMLREVGFQSAPTNASKFVSDFISRIMDEIQRA